MKVLVLSNMYPNFMGGNFIHAQAINLLNLGCKIKVVVPVPFYPKQWRGDNIYTRIPGKDIIDSIEVYYPRYFRLPGRWFHSLACYTQYIGANKTVHSIMNEFKPHILHAHAATVPGYTGLLLKKKYNIPLVCSLRGSDIDVYPHYDQYTMNLTRKLITESDQLLTVSHSLKVSATVIAEPKRPMSVIYNGCNHNYFTFNEEDRYRIRNKYGILPTDKVLIFIGSIERDKGIFELVTAFEKLHLEYSGLHLIIIGDGPENSSLDGLLYSNKSIQSIHRIGRVTHNDIPQYLSASDIFVFPSYHEGLPNAVLEAMACSLPVIATSVGGIPEAVEDGKSGILIKDRDEKSLEDALNYLLSRDDARQHMGAMGRKIVKSKFSWQQNAETVLGLYNDIAYSRN